MTREEWINDYVEYMLEESEVGEDEAREMAEASWEAYVNSSYSRSSVAPWEAAETKIMSYWDE